MATPVQLVFCFDRKTLSVERVRELLRYDPETGHFHRLHDMRKNRAGSISGSMNFLRNYWRVMVDGKEYKAHRLAWFYMTGKWPKADIDHIDWPWWGVLAPMWIPFALGAVFVAVVAVVAWVHR